MAAAVTLFGDGNTLIYHPIHSSKSTVKRLISTDGLPQNAAEVLRAHLIHKVLSF